MDSYSDLELSTTTVLLLTLIILLYLGIIITLIVLKFTLYPKRRMYLPLWGAISCIGMLKTGGWVTHNRISMPYWKSATSLSR